MHISVEMGFDQHMGKLYPFTLSQKLAVITEPCRYYTEEGAKGSPWGRPIIPFEMISVLTQYTTGQARFPVRQPAVGLFANQIRGTAELTLVWRNFGAYIRGYQENGMLVDYNDDQALADTICQLVDDPQLRRRLGHAAALKARQQFTAERYQEELFTLVQQVANQYVAPC